MRQRTIKNTVTFTGRGIITGKEISVEIKSATANSGICFELSLKDEIHLIPAQTDFINTSYDNRTALRLPDKKGIEVNFTEHLLSAFHGLGIDNASVAIDNIEVPFFDGSAAKFVDILSSAGTQEQSTYRRIFVPAETIYLNDGKRRMMLSPFNGFRVSYYLDYPDTIIGTKVAEIDINESNYRNLIGPSRSFILEKKLPPDVIKGTYSNPDADSVVIVHKDHYSKKLHSDLEPAYHKILDLLGDLYLAGCTIQGHISCMRTGHKLNHAMALKVREALYRQLV